MRLDRCVFFVVLFKFFTEACRYFVHIRQCCFKAVMSCAGNSPVTGEFPDKGNWRRTLMFLFDLLLNKRLSKLSCGLWFETPSRPLWRHCNDIDAIDLCLATTKHNKLLIYYLYMLYIKPLMIWCHDFEVIHGEEQNYLQSSPVRKTSWENMYTHIIANKTALSTMTICVSKPHISWDDKTELMTFRRRSYQLISISMHYSFNVYSYTDIKWLIIRRDLLFSSLLFSYLSLRYTSPLLLRIFKSMR